MQKAGVVASGFRYWRASSKGAAEEGRVHAVLVAGVGCQQSKRPFQKLASRDASAQKRILYVKMFFLVSCARVITLRTETTDVLRVTTNIAT
jgi:hypothetical protein